VLRCSGAHPRWRRHRAPRARVVKHACRRAAAAAGGRALRHMARPAWRRLRPAPRAPPSRPPAQPARPAGAAAARVRQASACVMQGRSRRAVSASSHDAKSRALGGSGGGRDMARRLAAAAAPGSASAGAMPRQQRVVPANAWRQQPVQMTHSPKTRSWAVSAGAAAAGSAGTRGCACAASFGGATRRCRARLR
jgi:D-alanyl-D-alanine dipeptidase